MFDQIYMCDFCCRLFTVPPVRFKGYERQLNNVDIGQKKTAVEGTGRTHRRNPRKWPEERPTFHFYPDYQRKPGR